MSFDKSPGWSKNTQLVEIKWLRPQFPDPIREVDKWYVRRSKRKIIIEKEARRRVVHYARKQIGEEYSIAASKWSERTWYCSLLIHKSYARTVTGMYLETYGRSRGIRAGKIETPEDLLESPYSEVFLRGRKKFKYTIGCLKK